MKVLFITPYPPGAAPSQRFRFEQYLPLLEQKGIICDIAPFLTMRGWKVIYRKGNYLFKFMTIISGFIRRTGLMFSVPSYDVVFIHREAAFIGPPVFEWIIARLMRKKMIYDFDDAVWLPNASGQNRAAAFLKWHSKVRTVCRWAWKVSCGNKYLCDFAAQYNSGAVLNPTTIDTEYHKGEKIHSSGKVIIGWTGSHTTMHHLDIIVPVIRKLEGKIDMEFRVISNEPPLFHLKSLRFVEWKKETEIDDLLKFDIGVMPMYDNEWTRGKCGFKILQYMALGIPAVASPAGVNREIITHGVDGFLCGGEEDWEKYILVLAGSAQKRSEMGAKGRKGIAERWSVEENKENFLGLFVMAKT